MASEPQTQIATTDVLLAHVRALVAAQPAAPRPVKSFRFLLLVYPGVRLRIISLVALFAGLFAITFFQSGSTVGIWLLRIFYISGASFFVLVPAWQGLTVARRVRLGLPATAGVHETKIETIEWPRRGRLRVHGRRTVHHPTLGDFREDFGIVAPWVADITMSSTLAVLVAPDEPKTWLTLGPAAWTERPREPVFKADSRQMV